MSGARNICGKMCGMGRVDGDTVFKAAREIRLYVRISRSTAAFLDSGSITIPRKFPFILLLYSRTNVLVNPR